MKEEANNKNRGLSSGLPDIKTVETNKIAVKWAVPRRVRTLLFPALDEVYSEKNEPTETPFWKNYVAHCITQPPSSTPTETLKRVKGDSKWPSIALMSFFNSNENLISFASSSRDAASVVVGGFEDSRARVWIGTTDASSYGQKGIVLTGHSQPIFGVSIYESKVLTCSGDGSIRFWVPFRDGKGDAYHNLLVYETVKNCPVWCVSFAPFGYYFATGGRDGSVRMWSIEKKQHLRFFSGHLADVDCVIWHPNVHYIFSGSSDKTARMWDVLTGECVRVFTGHNGGIECLTIHPNGRYLASGGTDGLVIVWDIEHGKKLKVWDVNETNTSCEVVHSLAWSLDGAFIAIAIGSNRICMFSTTEENLKSKETIPPRTFVTKCDPVIHLNFLKSDILLAAGLVT